jgi:hypothetical protein
LNLQATITKLFAGGVMEGLVQVVVPQVPPAAFTNTKELREGTLPPPPEHVPLIGCPEEFVPMQGCDTGIAPPLIWLALITPVPVGPKFDPLPMRKVCPVLVPDVRAGHAVEAVELEASSKPLLVGVIVMLVPCTNGRPPR